MKSETYNPVLPLDMLILDFLPDEGSMALGLYPIGETVRAVTMKKLEGKVKSSLVSTRMRVMHDAGLVVAVHTVGGHSHGKAWQVTPAGKAQLNEWKDDLSDSDRSQIGGQQ